MRRFIKVIAAIATATILLAFIATFWFLHNFKAAIAEVTDPSRYQQSLAELRANSDVGKLSVELAYFPPAIPLDATNIRFFYRPHFLQGGPQLQLRITLPAVRVNQIKAEIEATTRPTTLPDNFAPINFRDANNTGWAELPNDFQMYILGTKKLQNDPELEYAYGIAISVMRNEVIYWLEE